MIRSMVCWWFLALGVALTSPFASAEDAPSAEIAALGARCIHNALGETIGVDLSNTWVTDADLAKLARLPQLQSINLAYTKITDQGLEHLAPLDARQDARSVLRGIRHGPRNCTLEALEEPRLSKLARHESDQHAIRAHRAHDQSPIPGYRPQPGQRRLLRAPGESRPSRASLIRRKQNERRCPAVSEVVVRPQGAECFRPAEDGFRSLERLPDRLQHRAHCATGSTGSSRPGRDQRVGSGHCGTGAT